jgi:hypothetical protein
VKRPRKIPMVAGSPGLVYTRADGRIDGRERRARLVPPPEPSGPMQRRAELAERNRKAKG